MAATAEHGRPAFAESDGARVGQNGTIAPHAWPGGTDGCASDGVACSGAAQWLQIVTDVERAFALRAESLRSRGGDCRITARAFYNRHFGHSGNDNRWHESET